MVAWQEHSSYKCTARETHSNLPVCWQQLPVSSSSQEEKHTCQNAHGLNPLRQASLSMRLGHSTTHETKGKQAGRSQQHKSHNNKTHLWLVTKHIYSQWYPYAEQVDFYLQHHNQSTIWMPLGIVCFRSHQTEIKIYVPGRNLTTVSFSKHTLPTNVGSWDNSYRRL